MSHNELTYGGVPQPCEDDAELLRRWRDHLQQEREQLYIAKAVDKPAEIT